MLLWTLTRVIVLNVYRENSANVRKQGKWKDTNYQKSQEEWIIKRGNDRLSLSPMDLKSHENDWCNNDDGYIEEKSNKLVVCWLFCFMHKAFSHAALFVFFGITPFEACAFEKSARLVVGRRSLLVEPLPALGRQLPRRRLLHPLQPPFLARSGPICS